MKRLLPARWAKALLLLPAAVVGQGAAAADCASLATQAFEGNTTVTSATLVTSGTITTRNNLTLTNLPEFCRVQGTSKPSADSDIFFEVWLPTAWNRRFLSSGEGGYAGQPNYTRNGLDGGLDELRGVGHRHQVDDQRLPHRVSTSARSLSPRPERQTVISSASVSSARASACDDSSAGTMPSVLHSR